jgi:hypothetical protein
MRLTMSKRYEYDHTLLEPGDLLVYDDPIDSFELVLSVQRNNSTGHRVAFALGPGEPSVAEWHYNGEQRFKPTDCVKP